MRSLLILLLFRPLACLLALFTAMHAGASSVLPIDIDQMVAGSREIVHVRCLANNAVPDPLTGIATVTTFEVLDRAKGAGNSLLVVRQAGGTLDGQVIDFRVPKFVVGAEYVLFMPAPSAAGLASPVGLSQGVFGVFASTTGKEVGNGRSFADLLPGSAAAASAAARVPGAPAASRMGLSEFMTLMRTKAAGR